MSDVVEITEKYYDSKDADEFYYRIWGGEDIHIGTYKNPDEPIVAASRRTVERMAAKFADLPAGAEVLDIGAGYGGAARYLAKEQGYRVHCLNLSKVQNDRNRQMSAEQGLADKINVVDGDFENIPFDEAGMDLVMSQDSLLHSGNRFRVFQEVDRVLKPGGRFIFTDPMQKAGADEKALEPVLKRIHLANMGSVEDYDAYAEKLGWHKIGYDAQTEQLVNHYSAVLANLEGRTDELVKNISAEYIENMKRGLRHWIDAGKAGLLAWGLLQYEKPKS